ncbi:metallopeptidase family protein [Dermacoccus barathri]|uniref:Metallopeptidase family protein n=2 Tax=Dermacoccus TaxID=57495 RepID=A0ABX5ZEZ1_9MICO|nr:metallopeptidase family protein [Dermacoccus barathri]MBE7372350.1 metallopeptidase family protein [Dermacoccus barathri]QEH94304.1 metallopeptidase family protein [Dermacoccus abyssi]
MWLSRKEFEDAVGDALDAVPTQFLDRLDNVVFQVEDEPTPEQLADVDGGELLGLYVGVALPDRGDGYGWGSLPDRIYLFSGPIQRLSRTREEVVEQIRVTLLHEIGHYFGIDDHRLHELGWG